MLRLSGGHKGAARRNCSVQRSPPAMALTRPGIEPRPGTMDAWRGEYGKADTMLKVRGPVRQLSRTVQSSAFAEAANLKNALHCPKRRFSHLPSVRAGC